MNTILLLHGALGAKSQLDPLKTALENAGANVHSMNFSGHAFVPFSSHGFGIEIFAHDVITYLDLHELDQVDIFGYSMGGYVAMWLARFEPQRVGKVVTLGTKFDWDPASAEKEIGKMDADKIVEKVPAFARILEQRHGADWRELLKSTADMMRGLGEKPLLDDNIFRTIDHNVIVALGDLDDMADRNYSVRVSSLLAHGRFVLLTDTPHPVEKCESQTLVKLIVD
jgi:pimeloyl-ACP methyl ester carboxylesterase